MMQFFIECDSLQCFRLLSELKTKLVSEKYNSRNLQMFFFFYNFCINVI